jgi:hypothetical protein
VSATVHVYTFKAGLLSRLAHDLRLRCERFEIVIDDGVVSATFDAASLRVDGVVTKGRLDPRGLSPSDYAKIEATARDEVLATRRHPQVTLQGRVEVAGAGHPVVGGELTLAGRTAPLPRTVVRREGDGFRCTVQLAPSRWGIAPYRALAGALKLQDRVEIDVRVDASADAADLAAGARWSSAPSSS